MKLFSFTAASESVEIKTITPVKALSVDTGGMVRWNDLQKTAPNIAVRLSGSVTTVRKRKRVQYSSVVVQAQALQQEPTQTHEILLECSGLVDVSFH